MISGLPFSIWAGWAWAGDAPPLPPVPAGVVILGTADTTPPMPTPTSSHPRGDVPGPASGTTEPPGDSTPRPVTPPPSMPTATAPAATMPATSPTAQSTPEPEPTGQPTGQPTGTRDPDSTPTQRSHAAAEAGPRSAHRAGLDGGH